MAELTGVPEQLVWVVVWGDELAPEVDSIWATEAEAQKRADELLQGGFRGWRAEQWVLHHTWKKAEPHA